MVRPIRIWHLSAGVLLASILCWLARNPLVRDAGLAIAPVALVMAACWKGLDLCERRMRLLDRIEGSMARVGSGVLTLAWTLLFLVAFFCFAAIVLLAVIMTVGVTLSITGAPGN